MIGEMSATVTKRRTLAGLVLSEKMEPKLLPAVALKLVQGWTVDGRLPRDRQQIIV